MTDPSRNVINYKLVLLGETNVGKSCIASRFARNEFFEFQEPTIGASFLTQTVPLDDVTIKFEIWDTAGQERYKSLAPMYYRGAKAALVVYDMTAADSFEAAKKWVVELRRRGEPDVVIALAGNKCDLVADKKVDSDEAREYANQNKLVFMECSALTAKNISELFLEVAKLLPKTQAPGDSGITPIDDTPPRKTGCC